MQDPVLEVALLLLDYQEHYFCFRSKAQLHRIGGLPCSAPRTKSIASFAT
jgi:hypothetical protein